MLNLGAGEVILILVVELLVLGPRRLPEMARGIGKFMREFRRQTDEVRSVVEREFYRMDQDVSSGLEPQQSILPVQAPRPPPSLMAEASLPTDPGVPGPASASASEPPPGTVPARGDGAAATEPGPRGPPEGA